MTLHQLFAFRSNEILFPISAMITLSTFLFLRKNILQSLSLVFSCLFTPLSLRVFTLCLLKLLVFHPLLLNSHNSCCLNLFLSPHTFPIAKMATSFILLFHLGILSQAFTHRQLARLDLGVTTIPKAFFSKHFYHYREN